MVDSFVLRSVSQWHSYKDPHFMQDGAPLNLAFPVVRDLTAILPVAHGYQNGCLVICCCGTGPHWSLTNWGKVGDAHVTGPLKC